MSNRTGGPTAVNWNAPLIVSLVAIGAVALVAVSAVPGLISAAFTPTQDANTSAALEALLPEHEQLAAMSRDRFVGRSPFFVPSRPPERPRPRPKPKPREEAPAPVVETPKPVVGPPSTYQGPKPTSMLGSSVYFRDSSTWINVGAEENGVKVLGIVDAWTVSLGHRGGEYNVSIWGDREDEFFTSRYEGTLKSSGFVAGSVPNAKPSRPSSSGRPLPPGKRTRSASEMMPEPLTEEQVAAMDRGEARDAMEKLLRARQMPNLEAGDRLRVDRELQMLRKRLNPAS